MGANDKAAATFHGAAVSKADEIRISAQAIRAAVQGARDANDHIEETCGGGYADGFQYALTCIESVAAFLEGIEK